MFNASLHSVNIWYFGAQMFTKLVVYFTVMLINAYLKLWKKKMRKLHFYFISETQLIINILENFHNLEKSLTVTYVKAVIATTE